MQLWLFFSFCLGFSFLANTAFCFFTSFVYAAHSIVECLSFFVSHFYLQCSIIIPLPSFYLYRLRHLHCFWLFSLLYMAMPLFSLLCPIFRHAWQHCSFLSYIFLFLYYSTPSSTATFLHFCSMLKTIFYIPLFLSIRLLSYNIKSCGHWFYIQNRYASYFLCHSFVKQILISEAFGTWTTLSNFMLPLLYRPIPLFCFEHSYL